MTSAIDPNNIVGNYPVANQPNNTQGFRDNFTNTKTNFQYAADEITDLQNKAVLKAALTGTTLDNNMGDQLIYAALIQDFSATAVAITATSGSIAVDYSAGHYQTIVPTGSISLSFVNFPRSGTAGLMRLRLIISNTAYTVTLPSVVSVGTTGIQGYSANTITFAATGTYEFDFETVDAGTTITIFDLNRPLNYYTNSVTVVGNATVLSGTAVPSGGTTGAGLKMSSTANLGVFFGSGAPTIAAAQGSLYLRTDGTSTSTRLYVNTTGSTTWTNVTTAI